MKDILIYNAGPLFTEADQAQRRKEETLFDSLEGVKVFNPLTAPFNDEANSPALIFEGDNEPIQEASVFFFDLASNDPGTLVELGMVIQKIMDGKNIHVYPIISDFRVDSRKGYESNYYPVGYNSFLIGSLEANNIAIFSSFKDAFDQFVSDKEQYRNQFDL